MQQYVHTHKKKLYQNNEEEICTVDHGKEGHNTRIEDSAGCPLSSVIEREKHIRDFYLSITRELSETTATAETSELSQSNGEHWRS